MLKILLLSDLHQQVYVLKNLRGYLKKHKFGGVIIAGDLTNRNKESLDYAKKFVKIIEENPMEVFFIPGNNESEDVVNYFEKKKYSVNLRSKSFKGFKIAGIGGFGEEYYPGNFNIKDTILITHFPPILSNKNLKNAPLVHIFGHSHFSEYKKKRNKTLLVQLKAAIYNRAGILELPSLKVSFINFKNA